MQVAPDSPHVGRHAADKIARAGVGRMPAHGVCILDSRTLKEIGWLAGLGGNRKDFANRQRTSEQHGRAFLLAGARLGRRPLSSSGCSSSERSSCFPPSAPRADAGRKPAIIADHCATNAVHASDE